MRKPISQRTKRTNEKAYNAWFKFNDGIKNKSMTEPTEEEKQAVIAYFKREGFSLYSIEGIEKVYADLATAKEIIKDFVHECELEGWYDHDNDCEDELINEAKIFLQSNNK